MPDSAILATFGTLLTNLVRKSRQGAGWGQVSAAANRCCHGALREAFVREALVLRHRARVEARFHAPVGRHEVLGVQVS